MFRQRVGHTPPPPAESSSATPQPRRLRSVARTAPTCRAAGLRNRRHPTVPGRLRLGLAHGSAAPRAACASSQRRKPGLRQPGTCRRVSAAGQPHVTPSLRRALRYGIRAAAFPFPTQVVVGCGIRSRPSRRAPGRCTGRQRPHGRPRERHPPEGPQPSRRRPQPPLRSPTPAPWAATSTRPQPTRPHPGARKPHASAPHRSRAANHPNRDQERTPAPAPPPGLRRQISRRCRSRHGPPRNPNRTRASRSAASTGLPTRVSIACRAQPGRAPISARRNGAFGGGVVLAVPLTAVLPGLHEPAATSPMS